MPAVSINISQVTSQALRDKQYLEVFPEYYALAAVTENSAWHDHQNVLEHVIAVFARLEDILALANSQKEQAFKIKASLFQMVGSKSRLDILKVAILLHDIAKSDVLVVGVDGTASCPGHELIAAGRVKYFAPRFDLDVASEAYVERIVRYHGFISDILSLMIANQNQEKYFRIFKETVGDICLELILLMQADLLGSDLKKNDLTGYDERIKLLEWMQGEVVAALV